MQMEGIACAPSSTPLSTASFKISVEGANGGGWLRLPRDSSLGLLDKNEIYEWIGINMLITVYYNYEQEVLLWVLWDLPQEQLPPDTTWAFRWEET